MIQMTTHNFPRFFSPEFLSAHTALVMAGAYFHMLKALTSSSSNKAEIIGRNTLTALEAQSHTHLQLSRAVIATLFRNLESMVRPEQDVYEAY